jgi:hypothetical protein
MRNRSSDDEYLVFHMGIPLLQVADIGAYFGTKAILEAEDDAPISWRKYYDKFVKNNRIGKIIKITENDLEKLLDTQDWLKTSTLSSDCSPLS